MADDPHQAIEELRPWRMYPAPNTTRLWDLRERQGPSRPPVAKDLTEVEALSILLAMEAQRCGWTTGQARYLLDSFEKRDGWAVERVHAIAGFALAEPSKGRWTDD